MQQKGFSSALIIVIVFLLIIAGIFSVYYFTITNGIKREVAKAKANSVIQSNYVVASPNKTEPISISGQIVCLPQKGNIQNASCAYGFKGDDQKYYALKNLNQQDIISGKITTDQTYVVEGDFQSETDPKFETAGTIIVFTISHI